MEIMISKLHTNCMIIKCEYF